MVELPDERNVRRVQVGAAGHHQCRISVERALDDADLAGSCDDRIQILGRAVEIRLNRDADVVHAFAESTMHRQDLIGAVSTLRTDDHFGPRGRGGGSDSERVLEAQLRIDEQADVREVKRH